MMDRLKSNKRKYLILGICALLCLLGTGYYAWTLYDAHCKQVVEWNEGAKAAFEEALWMEVNKRAEIPMFHASNEEYGKRTLSVRIPDSVSVMTTVGWKKYKIDKKKYDNSLIKETNRRAMMGALLYESPLCIDTFAVYWNKTLLKYNIPAQGLVRYIFTDRELKNDTAYSISNNRVHFDSLTVNYLGFRCEHELVGYISYPTLLSSLSRIDRLWLIFPWVVFIMLFFSYSSIEGLFRRKFIKEKIVEKEIHVADVSIDKAKIFQLPDGSLFDSFVGTLIKGELTKQLPPQSAILLKLFLRKDNHRLSSFEIEQELWNGRGSADQIRQAIQRLRRELKAVSSNVVIKNVNGDYELKLPISS